MILTVTPNPLINYNLKDDPRLPGERRCSEFDYSVGGKGINVARMLKTLGRAPLSLTFAGGDNGRKILSRLSHECLPVRAIETSGQTRMGFDFESCESAPHRWWIEEGAEILDAEVGRMLDCIADEILNSSYLVISGSVPGRNNLDFYKRVLERCRTFSGEIFIDARDGALRQACDLGGFFLKHNREETISTFSIDPFLPDQFDHYAELLRSYKIWGAMITNGKDEVLLWDGATKQILLPPGAREVSSVGCGDATMAGLVYGRSEGMSIFQSAMLGLACGAADAECVTPCSACYSRIIEKFREIKVGGIEAFQ